LAAVSVQRIQEGYDATVRWRAYPLHPDIPPVGMDYPAYLGGEATFDLLSERVGGMAEALGLPFDPPRVKYNSRRADELTAWAVTEVPESADSLRMAIFEAIWSDGANNSDPAVLTEVAASVGIARARAVAALQGRWGGAAVDEDWRDAMARRIRGVPALFIGEAEVVGAQPWPVFAEALEKAGIRPRGA
jgi:predicted DsbA family dithiol-disulfide isomerase